MEAYEEYIVKPGDTMWLITQRYGLSVDELISANPEILNPELIYPGTIIKIPIEREADHGKIKPPQAPDAYPEIKVERRNLEYALILHDDFAGKVSETTAIMQYLYHYWDMEDTLEETAELLEEISKVEMHHMDMLAQLISALGGTPIYYNSERRMWGAEYIEYFTNMPCKQIIADIEGEKGAIENYQYHITLINDRYIKNILERIILDEDLHIRLLREEFRKYCR